MNERQKKMLKELIMKEVKERQVNYNKNWVNNLFIKFDTRDLIDELNDILNLYVIITKLGL